MKTPPKNLFTQEETSIDPRFRKYIYLFLLNMVSIGNISPMKVILYKTSPKICHVVLNYTYSVVLSQMLTSILAPLPLELAPLPLELAPSGSIHVTVSPPENPLCPSVFPLLPFSKTAGSGSDNCHLY
jgi:hypothetical protein